MKKHIPNFITSLNLTSGFAAIIFAASGDLLTASWMILAAMAFDFLDGFTARLLKVYSDIGKELDSLADVVSFGVAPGIIVYQLLHASMSKDIGASPDGALQMILMFISAIMPVCASIRLAVFNLDSTQTTTFRGMPTPANALAVISVIFAYHFSEATLFQSFTKSPLSIILFTIVLSFLMISRIPLLSLKFTNLRFKGNEGRYILISQVLIVFIIFGIAAAPLIIPLYLFSSLLSHFF